MRLQMVLIVMLSLVYGQAAYAAMRDPTMPLGYAGSGQKSVAEPNSLQLTATYLSSQRQIAVINGQFLTVGASIDGYQVVKIDNSTVQLKGNAGMITLGLVNEPVKTPVN